MGIRKGFSEKVTFNTMDSIEQKIDKLMVMMGKLVMEEDKIDNLSCKYISLIDVEVRLHVTTIIENFRTGLDQTMYTEDDQSMDKIKEVGQDMILIIEVVTDKMNEAIKGMGDRLIITREGKL